jgi:hypothetical protein
MLDRAYQKVVGENKVVQGPPVNEGDPSVRQTISRADILVDGEPNRERFIDLYVPTIRTLLATYPFLREDANHPPRTVNSMVDTRNTFALDLNHGLDLDPSIAPFTDWRTTNEFVEQVGNVVVMAGMSESTPTTVRQYTGQNAAQSLSLFDEIVSFSDYIARDPQVNEVWYEDQDKEAFGDGTVPLYSSVEQFLFDSRVKIKLYEEGGALPGLLAAQRDILEILGFNPDAVSIVTTPELFSLSIGNVWLSHFDPVGGVVTDADGTPLVGFDAQTQTVIQTEGRDSRSSSRGLPRPGSITCRVWCTLLRPGVARRWRASWILAMSLRKSFRPPSSSIRASG